MSPVWSFKFSLESILISNSFSQLLFCLCVAPMFTSIFWLVDNEWDNKKTWHLPSVAFIWFSLNRWNNIWSVRQSKIKRIAEISSPFAFNFASHISCERWSKALERSISKKPNFNYWSKHYALPKSVLFCKKYIKEDIVGYIIIFQKLTLNRFDNMPIRLLLPVTDIFRTLSNSWDRALRN